MPVFEQRIDNIVGIAYAMDLLDYVQKVREFSFPVPSKVNITLLILCDNLTVWEIIVIFYFQG